MEDEEFCAIPMGGCLPVHPQRVIGVGGTAGMVHPSTGYMVSRVLGVAPLIADAIVDQLSSGGWGWGVWEWGAKGPEWLGPREAVTASGALEGGRGGRLSCVSGAECWLLGMCA